MYLKHVNKAAFAGKFPVSSLIFLNLANHTAVINVRSMLLDVAEKLNLEKHHINY